MKIQEVPLNLRRRAATRVAAAAWSQLLACLNLPGGVVKGVHVRKVAIDVDMEDDGCCG